MHGLSGVRISCVIGEVGIERMNESGEWMLENNLKNDLRVFESFFKNSDGLKKVKY